MNKSIYNTKRGCVLIKSKFDSDFIDNIKKQLTTKPYSAENYGQIVDDIKVYLENNKKLYIPLHWAWDNIKMNIEDQLPEGQNINIEFNGALRDNQVIPTNTTIDKLNKKNGGILCLSCGAGKTAIALYIISKFKKKTLILVHKEFLVMQWKERIETFLPNAKIGLIQQNTIDIDNKDVVIGMLQSISQKKYELTTFDSFGMTIIDECHRIPCKVFSKALFKINCKYMLGLSATPNRKDGLTKILKWHIGDILYADKKIGHKLDVKVERYILYSTNEAYLEEAYTFRGNANRSKMLTNITQYMNRTNMIIKCIEKYSEGRKILVLSSRLQHLKDIYNKVSSKIKTGYYIGGMKQDKLKKTEECDLILGSYPMAEEGMDIKALDTIILASPKTDIEQAVGRILRKQHEHTYPLIIDIVDNYSVFSNQSKKRLNYYRSKKYNIFDIKFNDNCDIISTNENIKVDKKTDLTNNLNKKNLFSKII